MPADTLPIEAVRSAFCDAVQRRRRVVLTAETGAGKSTRVPVWLGDLWQGLVLVVEPRRVACEALAGYLAAQRGESVGQTIGSRVRFSDRSSEKTRVLFCTPGVALRILGGDRPVELAALVVDEFHERSWQMDLIVATAATLPRFRGVPLVLTSATLDADAAAAALDAETLHATGRTYPVAVHYDGEAAAPTDQDLTRRVGRAVERALADHPGDVLAFLPGMREIREVAARLGRRDEEIVPVHGTLPPESMRRVFDRSDRRRIYLATNVAETSLTLPGVRIVIDSGLAKIRLHRAGRTVLATAPIADASMQQRAGRAGRVAAGVCIRLWSERHKPEPFQRPEIERVELDDMLLQAAELGLRGPLWNDALWVTPPPAFAVRRARERLVALSAVDDATDALTDRGRRLAQLPVSADEAALLVGAPDDLVGTLCDLVAILQGRGSLLRDLGELPPVRRDAVRDARIDLLEGIADEVSMHLRLVRSGDPGTHHLSRRRLQEARAIRTQLRELVGVTDPGPSDEAPQGLALYVLQRLPGAGFVRRPRADRSRGRSEPWANGTIEVQVYPFEPLDPELEPPKVHAAVILETDWLAGTGGVTGIGRMVLPTQLEVLAKAGLGDATLTDVRLAKRSGKLTVSAVRETLLAGVTLAAGPSELSGDELCQAVAGFVLENRLFKGAGEAVRDALHGWALLAQWRGEPLDEYRVQPPGEVDPAPWLRAKLRTLGLETASDLELLDADDLIPDLEAETGVPAWVTKPLLEAFPRVWSYSGGAYACTVHAGLRTVQLEPLDTKAKKLKEPPSSALPRFYGFAVTFQQGSRRLRLR